MIDRLAIGWAVVAIVFRALKRWPYDDEEPDAGVLASTGSNVKP